MTRTWLRSLAPTLLLLALASPVLLAGCRSQTTVVTQPEPSDYRQWEQATHRPHVDFEKRTADERKEYQDWHESHGHQ